MRWFIPLFLLVFALMHIYPYMRFFRPAVRDRFKKRILAALFVSGFLSPFVWRYADANASPQIAYITAFAGLFWLGFLFYLFWSGLVVDLYRGVVFISKKFLGINPLPLPSKKLALGLVLLSATSLSAYSHYETLNLRVEKFQIPTDKLPEGIESIKVMHISDVHLGPVMGLDKIKLLLQVYERERPHLVVSTGDFVDGNMRNKLNLTEFLNQMKPPLGKFAVLGNHEYYRGVEQAIDFTQRAGFRLLRGEFLSLKGYNITLAGIDDKDCLFFKKCNGTLSDRELLKNVDRKSFVIYLKHKPRLEDGSAGLFDLMLSGHTHGGVYYPVGKLILTKMFISDRGLHQLGNSYVYISKGVGTGGPPMRLFSPPDVAIIEIVNKRR